MTIAVVVTNDQDDALDVARLERLARDVLAAENVPGDAELSVLFVTEDVIADLNERFLGHVGPTDVLSFPIEDPSSTTKSAVSADVEVDGPPTLLGDVVICPAVAAAQAGEHGSTYEDELALLLTHGILHILGRDHEADGEAEEMEAREQELLDQLFRTSREPTP